MEVSSWSFDLRFSNECGEMVVMCPWRRESTADIAAKVVRWLAVEAIVVVVMVAWLALLLRLWKFAKHHKGPQISYAAKFMFR